MYRNKHMFQYLLSRAESMVVQLSILPQPSGTCLTKQMALSEFFHLGRRVEACTARILDSICLPEYTLLTVYLRSIMWNEERKWWGWGSEGGEGQQLRYRLKNKQTKKQFRDQKFIFKVFVAIKLLCYCAKIPLPLLVCFLICEMGLIMFPLLTSHTFIGIKQV